MGRQLLLQWLKANWSDTISSNYKFLLFFYGVQDVIVLFLLLF